MEWALAFSAGLLGLAGTPHCAAMCGAACMAAVGRSGAPGLASFHLARLLGYAAAGAIAAASVGVLGVLGEWSPALRPLWTLVHAGALSLGLWLLITGRQPAWLERVGASSRGSVSAAGGGWQRIRGPVRAGVAGGLWFAWPCGLLQSALLVASLANTPAGGAMAMAAFAATSALGLTAAPWLWQRLGGGAAASVAAPWAVRGAGLLLAAGSAWALGHGLWAQVLAYCMG